jgi:hypothetical protein
MCFLPNPIELFSDETLESALLRLCCANHFEHYNDLSIEIRSWLEERHPTIAGAFPLALDAVNVYHANQSSAKRVQALQLLEQLVGLPKFSLLDISFKHTNAVDIGQFSEVRYKQITIPKVFLRSTNIPVCVECLKEDSYARFDWHITKVTCCEKHNVKLLSECPACHIPLNYMISEDPTKCVCGQDLMAVSGLDSGVDGWRSWSEGDQSPNASLSKQLAVFLILERYFPSLTFDEFVGNASSYIRDYLLKLIEQNLQLATDKVNRLTFANLTNNFLNDVSRISSLPVSIQECISNELIDIAMSSPRSTVANIGDSLVSLREATLITGSSIEDLYRLYENGILILGKRLRGEGKLDTFNPVFRLRDVASVALSYSKLGYSQSAW